jgi:polygalacturonase
VRENAPRQIVSKSSNNKSDGLASSRLEIAMKTNKQLRVVLIVLFASLTCLMLASGQQPFAAAQARSASTFAGDASSVYNVRTFGARGDGKTLDTQAINKAIDAPEAPTFMRLEMAVLSAVRAAC